ncbi:PREDICTED: cell wall protein RBR3-like [Nicotiana attenuata]|uniref:cell wall protein RBR3-like n=1 Tax=Nicotiana attenuata TaxID=49451 RepID=UPI000904AC40|nr:PREDICTED: cell wall protein RBR3-like [Nicotiana attenuata]
MANLNIQDLDIKSNHIPPLNLESIPTDSMQETYQIITPTTNPITHSDRQTPTAVETISSYNSSIYNAQNPIFPAKENKTNPNSKATDQSHNGKPTTNPPSTSTTPNNLCPTSPSPGLPTTLMDGDGVNGSCSVFQHPSDWSGNDSEPPQHSIPCSTNLGGNGSSNEQLPKPNLAQQHPSSPCSLNKSQPSSNNDPTVKHASTLQPSPTPKHSSRSPIFSLRDANSSQPNIHAMGHQPPTSGSTYQPGSATGSPSATPCNAGTGPCRGRYGRRSRGTPQPSLRASPRILKLRRGKSVSIQGVAGEEARSQLSPSTLQVFDGYKATSGSYGGEQGHDSSTYTKEEPYLSRGVRDNGEAGNQQPTYPMNHPTNIIIWNIRGGNNDNFRRNFREMLDTHCHCMVALLETRLVNHENWLDEFGFSQLIEVPAEGQSGGMVVMWKHGVVSAQNFTRRNQEIHATIEALLLNAEE